MTDGRDLGRMGRDRLLDYVEELTRERDFVVASLETCDRRAEYLTKCLEKTKARIAVLRAETERSMITTTSYRHYDELMSLHLPPGTRYMCHGCWRADPDSGWPTFETREAIVHVEKCPLHERDSDE